MTAFTDHYVNMLFNSISSLHRISSSHYFQSRPCQNLSMCFWPHGLCLLKKEKLRGKKSQRIALHWQLWERSWNGSLDASKLCRGCETCGRKPESEFDEFGRKNSEALEKFARENGDDAVLFGPNKRPFLAATIQTFIRKLLYFLIDSNKYPSHAFGVSGSIGSFLFVSTIAAVLFLIV